MECLFNKIFQTNLFHLDFLCKNLLVIHSVLKVLPQSLGLAALRSKYSMFKYSNSSTMSFYSIFPSKLVPSVKESYTAQNSLKLKLPSRSSPPFYAKKKKELSHPKKKMDTRLMTPSSQLVQPLANLQNSLPQPFKR